VLLIGAGVTLHESLTAADQLATSGVAARVLDLYSVKPIDRDTLVACVRAARGRVVVTEDHYPEGGLGEAVMEALAAAGERVALRHLAVRDLPGSGSTAELLKAAGISADDIAEAARALLASAERAVA
jgi:transketolase